MNAESIERVKETADKINLQDNEVIRLLVQQARTYGYCILSAISIETAVIVVTLIIWFTLVMMNKHAVKQGKIDCELCKSKNSSIAEWCWLVLILTAVALILTLCTTLSPMLTAFTNPELWALERFSLD